ncbi:MAG TPA: DNA translocase FtsK 4TM domain-containing protein, partial [Vicinamibacteria bacterium]
MTRERRRAEKGSKRLAGRWLRDVQATLALALASFGLIALAAFDPALAPGDQVSPVGPIGAWTGWGLFRAFGYASYLFPLLLGLHGVAAFSRGRGLSRGLPALAGGGILIVALTGLLAVAADAATHTQRGGLLGWAVSEGLWASVGTLGAWLVLVALVPVGLSFATQVSYAALSRSMRARAGALRRRKRGAAPTTSRAEPPAPVPVPMPDVLDEDALPIVVEPGKPRGTLVEKGLAWQETFDFGKGGAQSFQLPPVGLLQVLPATALRQTREALQDNAETLRRKLQDFGVEGRIVQVSPGPVITAYEFEPAAGVKVSQVVNLADDLALSMKVAAVRIVGPIPGRGTVAVEVPNPETATVYLREVLVSPEFAESKGRLPLALGKDVTGQPVVSDLASMPHLLIAGATGAGKSVGLNSMICSVL